MLTKSVSTCTISPGRVGFSPLGRRLAWRLPMKRKRRPPGLRRSVGTGVTTPRRMRLLRMRPTVETETAKPSRREQHGELALAPHRVVGSELFHRLDQRRATRPACAAGAGAGSSARAPSPSDRAWSAARRRSPPLRPPSGPWPWRAASAASASRLLAAAIFGIFASIRRDARRPLRITWPGRPKTCIGGSP